MRLSLTLCSKKAFISDNGITSYLKEVFIFFLFHFFVILFYFVMEKNNVCLVKQVVLSLAEFSSLFIFSFLALYKLNKVVVVSTM